MAISINKDSAFLPAQKPTQEDGWMAPDGTFYPCRAYYHSEAADSLTGMSVSYLEDNGWLHISFDTVRNFRFVPTQDQLNTMFDMFMVNPTSDLADAFRPFLDIEEEE